jgi:hypothetical protein
LSAVRRTVPLERLSRHSEQAGYVYAVIGVVYGVILAQVVVAAWDQYQSAEAVASTEADAVLNLARLAEVLPANERAPVIASLRTYAEHVIEVEWPAMEHGDIEITLQSPVIHDLWQTVIAASARQSGSSAVAAQSLEQLDTLSDARRSRAVLAEGGLPLAMRLTLLLGALITIGFSYLFVVDDTRVQGIITASLAALTALLLLLEFQLETPYQGVSRIEPTAMEFVLRELESPAATR